MSATKSEAIASLTDWASEQGSANTALQEKLQSDMKRMYQEKLDELAYGNMRAAIIPTPKELDHEILRDLLVDLCKATQPEAPPDEEAWKQLRNRVKEAAVNHALLNREEKKTPVKKPWTTVIQPPRYGESEMSHDMMTRLIATGTSVNTLTATGTDSAMQGRFADLLVVDDVI